MKMADEEVREWWMSAVEELKIAEDMLNLGWYSIACFHAQQAAEKGLKALLIACGRLERTHALPDLLEEAARHGLDVRSIEASDIRVLSDQYMAPRYPNFRRRLRMQGIVYEYTRTFGEYCIQVAREVLRRVRAWLVEHGHLSRE